MCYSYPFCKLKLSLSLFILLLCVNLKSQTYCSTTYNNGTGSGDYISLVQIPTTTLNSASAGAASPYYTLFSATGSTTAILQRGNTTPYTLNVAGGTSANCYIAAWGDWNKNGTFETSEFIGVSSNAGNSTTVSITNGIRIPENAVIGSTRIRLRSSNVSPGPNVLASCGGTNSDDGETEDYIITIECQFTSAPTASFSFLDSIFAKSPVTLINGNSSYLESSKWYVNGVFKKDTHDLNYIFPAAGNYTICLKSTNCFGTDSACLPVKVFNATQIPIAAFTSGIGPSTLQQELII